MGMAALQVTGHLLGERILRRRARTLDDIPGSVAAITPEWLTAVMCRNHPGAQVTHFRVTGGSDGSHARRQLALEYNAVGVAARLPSHVFTKTLDTLVTRMLGGFMGHARYEMLFYTRLRPLLTIETPLCYHSRSDKVSLAAIHVLEDLVTTKGATFMDESTVLSFAQAEDLVDLLADLHGQFYASPRLATEFSWITDYVRWFTKGIERVHTDRYSLQALKKAEHVIPASINARRDDLWPATMRALEVHRQSPQTLIHTDVHVANWYLTAGNKVGLLDWQLITIGHWSRDLSHALLTCLGTVDRRRWERHLMERYLDRMHRNTGVRLDANQAWLAYRQQALHTLTQWTQTLCHPPFQPDSHPDKRTYCLIQRITQAMEDLESLDSI
jgi:aminoglycoside phosphotransferase (APT) family kinase protein